jgi:uncharacterized protein (TIGR02266 family)
MDRKRWKVLLADDVELFLELERTFLQRESIELLVARNGLEALETIRREHPDLILLDLYMPVLDGPDVCRAVKSDPGLCATPVLMVTSGGRDEERQACAAAGCDGILTKPINRHSFLTAVRGHLQIIEREAHRVPARLLVRYGVDAEHVLTDYSVNVSTGGIFIETDRAFAVDEALTAAFVLPDRVEELRCRARVAWVNQQGHLLKPLLPPGIGVQFLDLTGEERAEILAFIKRRLLSPLW